MFKSQPFVDVSLQSFVHDPLTTASTVAEDFAEVLAYFWHVTLNTSHLIGAFFNA